MLIEPASNEVISSSKSITLPIELRDRLLSGGLDSNQRMTTRSKQMFEPFGWRTLMLIARSCHTTVMVITMLNRRNFVKSDLCFKLTIQRLILTTQSFCVVRKKCEK